MSAAAVRLGRHVTVVRITDGLHDLVLSAPRVRKEAMEEMGRFLNGYLSKDQVADGTVGGTRLTA